MTENKKTEKLPQALRFLVSFQGKDYLNELQIINALSDLKAFDENPALKNVFHILQMDGYLKKISLCPDWNSASMQLVYEIACNYSFSPVLIEYILKSVVYGLRGGETPTLKSDKLGQVGQSNTSIQNIGGGDHLMFKGVEICGRVSDFVQKLTLQGLEECTRCDEFITMTGTFTGIPNCRLLIYFNPSDQEVYKVTVRYPWSELRNTVMNDYKTLKKNLISKYGNPENEKERGFDDWCSTFVTSNGTINLLAFPGTCLQVWIEYCDNYHGSFTNDVEESDL